MSLGPACLTHVPMYKLCIIAVCGGKVACECMLLAFLKLLVHVGHL